MSAPDPALHVQNVSLRRGGRNILHHIDVKVGQGGFLSIIGPNGSGKSSLLRALSGLWPISEGVIQIAGRRLGEYGRRELAQIVAVVPQDTRMDFAFTVEEVVAMGRFPRRSRFQRATGDDRRAVDGAIANCDLDEFRDRLVTTLSGGERQRVAIARSLAVEPEIILLDEPTASLDVQHSLEILDLCSALCNSGTTIVLTTHDLNAVTRYTTEVALIKAGRIAYFGQREGILTANVLESVFGVRVESLTSAAGHPIYNFHRTDQDRTD